MKNDSVNLDNDNDWDYDDGGVVVAGDPTVFGNLSPPCEAIEAVVESVRSTQFNGYAPSTGKLHQ